jgi:hypothetical protein
MIPWFMFGKRYRAIGPMHVFFMRGTLRIRFYWDTWRLR